MVGGAKELVGKLLGDAKLQVEARGEQAAGKLQNAAGNVKGALRK